MRGIVIVFAAMALSACATVQKLDAAADVHALMIAIRDGDRATFKSLVDEQSLKQDLQSQLVAEARRDPRVPSVVAAILAPGLADLAGDLLIRPEVFRAVAEGYGYRRDMAIPGPIGISTLLRPVGDGRVCAPTKQGGPCQLIFTQAPNGRWRLSGFTGDVSRLRLTR